MMDQVMYTRDIFRIFLKKCLLRRPSTRRSSNNEHTASLLTEPPLKAQLIASVFYNPTQQTTFKRWFNFNRRKKQVLGVGCPKSRRYK